MVDFETHNPLDGSAAVATTSGEVGTAGCLVRVGSRPVCILSSAHVLAAGTPDPAGIPVFQPPATHFGSTQIGRVWDAYVPDRTGKTLNLLDAAIAVLSSRVSSTPVIGGLGAPKGFNSNVVENERVHIHGAGSGTPTSGKIIQLGDTKSVDYSDGSTAWFVGLVRCERYSLPGDSGAAVLDDDGFVVGVHLCGTDSFSWFCPISAVKARWNDISIVT